MFDSPGSCRKDRAIIEFLFWEEIVKNIHENIYRKTALDVSKVRRLVSTVNGNPWEKAETDLSDRPYSGRTVAAIKENKGKEADALIIS